MVENFAMENGEVFSTEVIPSFLEKLGVSLGKRRSCELVETASPCVRKALFHLQNLQGILNDGGRPKVPNENQKEVKFLQNDEEDSITEESEETEDSLLAELMKTFGGKAQQIYTLKTHQEAPNEIFRQVTELILRLEDDRIKTEKSLTSERNRMNWLDKKLEEMMIKRMTTLPLAVQQEHEACARNIGELDWHVTNSVNKRRESLQALEEVKSVNEKLKSEIKFISSHCPLVEEKLEIEQEAFAEQKALQDAANAELENVQTKLREAETIYNEHLNATEIEVEKHDLELTTAKKDLELLKEKYHKACLMEESYKKKSVETQNKTKEMEKNYTQLVEDLANIKKEERQEAEKTEKLQERIDKLKESNANLDKEIERVQKMTENTEEKRGKELSKLEKIYEEKLAQLKYTEETNVKLKLDVEDIGKKIRQTEKEIARSKSETERLVREQLKNEEKMTRGMQKIETMKDKNSIIQAQIDKEEEISRQIEDNLKIKVEDLRREVDMTMKERIEYEKKKEKTIKHLNKAKSEHLLKKTKLEQELTENDEALRKIQSELHIAKSQHHLATQTMEKLTQEMKTIETEHKKLESELTGKKEKLLEVSTSLQNQHEALTEELIDMKKETAQLKPQIADMKTSQTAMFKKMKETESNLQLFNGQLSDIKFNYEGKEKIIALLKQQLSDAQERLKRRARIHRDIMRKRNQVKAKLEKGNVEGVDFNSKAAESYRKLQTMHMDLKNNTLKLYDEKLILENSMKDYKQLVEMQQKMNWALRQYYENRSNFNQNNLHNFNCRTRENSIMVAEVQKGLEIALLNVEDFLEAHIDGTAQQEVRKAGYDLLKTATSSSSVSHDPFKLKTPLPPVTTIREEQEDDGGF